MNKKLLLILVVIGCVQLVYADNDSQEDKKIVSTFYGSKASSNANNPCKGSTIRVCGTIEQSLVSLTSEELPYTLVERKTFDANGGLMAHDIRVENISKDELKREIIQSNLKSSAKVEIVNYE